MKKTVSVSAVLLSGELRKRFEAMLPVVATRSIVHWRLTDIVRADVLLSERLPRASEVVHQVTVQVADQKSQEGDGQQLVIPYEFRVSVLMAALDLAALRVLDRKSSTKQAEPQLLKAPRDERMYRLKYWVVPDDRASLRLLRTLAGMTRHPVTYAWLQAQGGLSGDEVDVLLTKLELLGALRVTAIVPVLVDEVAQHPVPPPEPQMPDGFVARLRNWLRGARAVNTPATRIVQ